MLLTKITACISQAYQWLLPAHCILCAAASGYSSNLCSACRQDLPILPYHCRQCAHFLPFSTEDLICGACLQTPPPFDSTYALFPYQFPITQLIIQLKFQQRLSHARALAELLTERVQTVWYKDKPLPDLLIPIPLHRLRLRERGFNQALEIAKPLARHLGIKLDYHSIQRIKATSAQSGLAATARQKNMAHAFAGTSQYNGLVIAVIDDVMTTGHTLRAFCRLLKAKGAARIDIWCCARRG